MASFSSAAVFVEHRSAPGRAPGTVSIMHNNVFSRIPRFARHALAVAACLTCCPLLRAQETVLDPVIVTGNPLGSREVAVPVSVLSGDELVLRRGSSLGETLAQQPGVSSTYFGPHANRPVVRGLDGDRVRILSNAGGSIDASSLSYDHAVPIDPLVVERLEVLRGPGALLYGGSAMGGVVNTIDNRIPAERIQGMGGAAEARLGGADRERGGAALVEAGDGRYAVHADVFGRHTDDLRVPRYTAAQDGQVIEGTTVRNSASRTLGGALGASVFFEGGHVGLSADTYDSRYGTPAEPDIHLNMKRDHIGLAFEQRDETGPLRAVRVNINGTDYRHEEVESDGAVGTVFKSRGHETRIEVQHAPVANVRGALGLQWEDVDFSALGDEAFVPSTRTRKLAFFGLEEVAWAGGTLSAGARVERALMSSEGDPDASSARFGAPTERRYTVYSTSLSNVMPLFAGWSASVAASLSERAPTSYELYANGVHAATGAFERGDVTLPKERGANMDFALQWKGKTGRLRTGVFLTRFSRFISLDSTASRVEETDAEGNVVSFPEFAYRAVRATLRGIEVDGRWRLLDGRWTLDLAGKLDYTRGTNEDTGEPLPRVAPLRLTLGLNAGRGPWRAGVELAHAARQSRIPATDTPTDAYTLVNFSLTRKLSMGDADATWFVKVDNAGDVLAYSANTIQTVRGFTPLPGRSLKTGIRVTF
jgi:iron complex outermembrane receptor protein